MTASLVDGPGRGTVTLSSDGSFEYTPNANFAATDLFRDRVLDGVEASPPATATIKVTPVDDPPVAQDDVVELDEDTTVNVNVLGNDSDSDDRQ